LILPGIELAEGGDDLVRIEAKPPHTAEMRLIDAATLLGALPELIGKFERLAMPWAKRRPQERYAEEDDASDA